MCKYVSALYNAHLVLPSVRLSRSKPSSNVSVLVTLNGIEFNEPQTVELKNGDYAYSVKRLRICHIS